MKPRLSEIAFFTEETPAVVDWFKAVLNQEGNSYGPDMTEFDLDGVTLRVHFKPPVPVFPAPDENHIAFSVADLDAEVVRLRGLGIGILREPTEYPWGRSAYLRAPNGVVIELAQVE